MEEMINIAKILKNKPKGTRLYSPIFGECVFCYVHEVTDDICVEYNREKAFFSSKGLYNALGECLLFPSREMRDWSKFAWKKGDVLISDYGFVCIFKEWASDDYTKFNGCYFDGMPNAKTDKYSKLDNNTAYGYIREIERKLGGKLNLETLEVEKAQPEFKDWDILSIQEDEEYYHTILIFKGGTDVYVYFDCFHWVLIYGTKIDENEKSIYHLATEEEKKQLFSALEKEGKVWDAKKKMIVSMKLKVELKPFDNVLVRHQKTEEWRANIFSHTDKTDEYLDYVCVNGRWEFCIPYEGNESLLGTTKDVEVSYGRSF